MSLFDRLGGHTPSQNPQQGQQMDPQMLQQMQRDVDEISRGPGVYLQARGYNIPEGMTDVRQITQYLLRTGQVGAQKVPQVFNRLGLRK